MRTKKYDWWGERATSAADLGGVGGGSAHLSGRVVGVLACHGGERENSREQGGGGATTTPKRCQPSSRRSCFTTRVTTRCARKVGDALCSSSRKSKRLFLPSFLALEPTLHSPLRTPVSPPQGLTSDEGERRVEQATEIATEERNEGDRPANAIRKRKNDLRDHLNRSTPPAPSPPDPRGSPLASRPTRAARYCPRRCLVPPRRST